MNALKMRFGSHIPYTVSKTCLAETFTAMEKFVTMATNDKLLCSVYWPCVKMEFCDFFFYP